MTDFPTTSHAEAYERLVAMGELFFNKVQPFAAGLTLRLQALLVGPTGCGKSHLVRQVSTDLGCHYMKATYGEWMPLGGKGSRPTIFQIIDLLHFTDKPVLLHLDELDKVQPYNGSDWAASISSDLYNVLDRRLNLTDYALNTTYAKGCTPPSLDELRSLTETSLFIVGSGTWQHLYEVSAPGKTIGFGAPPTYGVDGGTIARSGLIPSELLTRFNGDLVFLRYPNREETEMLLDRTGVRDLAGRLGVKISADQMDWANRAGLRELETLATRLALEVYRQSKYEHPFRAPRPHAMKLPEPRRLPAQPNVSG